MKFYLSIFLILVSGCLVFGQPGEKTVPKTAQNSILDTGSTFTKPKAACTLGLLSFKGLRGLKLMMPLNQVKAIFPSVIPKITEYFPKSVTMGIVSPSGNDEFKDISQLYLYFYKDKLVNVMVYYRPTVQWKSVVEIRDDMIGSLNIPGKYWNLLVDKQGYGTASAECKEFKVSAMISNTGSPSSALEFSTTDYFKKATDEEQRKQKTAKP